MTYNIYFLCFKMHLEKRKLGGFCRVTKYHWEYSSRDSTHLCPRLLITNPSSDNHKLNVN